MEYLVTFNNYLRDIIDMDLLQKYKEIMSGPLTKEKAIKRYIVIAAGTVIFAGIMMTATYGKNAIKPFLIVSPIVVAFMGIVSFFAYKYKDKFVSGTTQKKKRKTYFVYLALGVLITILNLFAYFMIEQSIIYMFQIALGVAFVILGIRMKKKYDSKVT